MPDESVNNNVGRIKVYTDRLSTQLFNDHSPKILFLTSNGTDNYLDLFTDEQPIMGNESPFIYRLKNIEGMYS